MAGRLFISNIDATVTVDNLKGVISQIAEPSSVVIAIDQKTKIPKGFGFVEFENTEDMKRVLEELNGYVLNGKALKVSVDRSYQDRNEIGTKQEQLPTVQRVALPVNQQSRRTIDISQQRPVSFKNVQLLNQFLSQRGKILGRKYTGLSRAEQNEVARAIKRARQFGLIRPPDMKVKPTI
ncbi:MAG: 30S ribosomal protein S18 [Deltaproteobacteria bacterium]|nr:30S ribosomal protein S18 [Deltaproteobacteria bacterium]MCX7953048.1 30S ribosomal protein S18 [Deltaproteobacteria bacterium]